VRFEAVFDALAAGTFFYIADMDILSEEFQDSADVGRDLPWPSPASP
jgi:hypothetical protein